MDVLPLWLLLPIMMILILMAPQPTQALATRSKLNPRVVQTRYGKIQGLVLSFENTRHLKPIDVYLGVPYATPPTGGNRFSPTRALSPWDGNKLAEKLGPVCPQKLPDISDEKEALDRMPRGRLEYLKRILPHLRNQSEDCLYLNIYAPAMGMSEGGRKHPVLVFIHGESYEWGSGNTYDGSVLASYTDQIVITLNYRLGVLGFLNANVSPHTKARVANYGLMDQIAALHWVQQNIEYFGGDPSNVTLMGQGTGAACVNFLAISPTVMPGLFKRAILLSGSALSSWAVVEEPVSYALKLAEAVNCSVPKDLLKDHELLVDCLRESSLEALLRADVRPPTFLSAFGPSVDGVVIKPDFQKDLLSYLGPEFQGFGILPKKAEHGEAITSNNKYDLLFGVTTSEALWRFAERDVEKGFEGERRDRIIRTYVRNAYMYHLTEIFYTIVNEYTDWERTVQHPMNTRDACVQALSDAQFVAPLVQTGDLFTLRHTKRPNGMHVPLPVHDADKEPLPKTYFYVFDYQMKDGDYPQRMGSVHGEELPFVFGAPLVDGFGHFPRNYTKAETQLSESIIQYFANFVRTGNPNAAENHGKADAVMPISREKSRFRSLTWDQYDPVHQKYLEIGMKPKMKNHYRAHQLSVWLRLVPELHRAGMEDVEPRHNLFRGYADPNLYDGFVRPDPLSRIVSPSNDLDSQRRGAGSAAKNATTELPTTTDYSLTTCVSLIQSTNIQNIHNASTDTLASLDAAGYATYSTALSVTIAIGCSLLILNVLIFAGVYYQRDKTRLEVKSLQQQQMMNQQCGPRGFNDLKQPPPPPPPHTHFPGGGQVIVDVENEMIRRNVMKTAPPSETNILLQQTQVTHTLPHPHHYQKQHHTQHSTLPRGSVLPDISTQQSQIQKETLWALSV
ncbi:neuroligin-4, Y-linked isoform X2 [Nasonia vitripennis]|uniref:Carboxylesterase type B domain-containing protein n=1 Tax=Nasonia vitripennis TaxID=7425 RepID=A0A7M7T9P1_NASVI|nr:neuroligin-4, Y-linked isoform X2 [Nasonia vitripennis]XP_031785232.1 neuroligin-4, Y-linked isoform X2 [Nasonia vitripennis]